MSRKNWDTAGLKEALSRGGAKEHGGVENTTTLKRRKVGDGEHREASRRLPRYTEAQGRSELDCNQKPVANPAHAPINKNAKYAPYKNKLEYSYAQVCEHEKQAGLIKDWAYESMTLKLSVAMPGKRGDYHRTDFLKWHKGGSIEIAQTKGWHKNIQASLKGLRWAAQKNPWFRFTIKRYKNGWTSEEIHP